MVLCSHRIILATLAKAAEAVDDAAVAVVAEGVRRKTDRHRGPRRQGLRTVTAVTRAAPEAAAEADASSP